MFLLMMNILTFDTPYVPLWFCNSYLIFRRLHWTVGNGYESYVVVIPAMRWHLLDSFVKIWYNFPNMTQYWHQYNTNLKKSKRKWSTSCTGKSLSEALLFAEHGENMLCTKIFLNVRNNFCTQHVLPRFELGIFMYWNCNSMNNLSSYCGLVDAKIRASDKDLPVNH